MWRGIAFFALFVVALPAVAGQIAAKIVGVSDGDTVTAFVECAKLDLTVRLAGIDAPEKGMPHGDKAKNSLSDLAFGKQVVIEYDKRDKYGRYVGKVLIEGTDINLVQLERGYAWHYKHYANEQSEIDRQAYAAAENKARAEGIGLWKDSLPTPPWDWRHNKSMRLQNEKN